MLGQPRASADRAVFSWEQASCRGSYFYVDLDTSWLIITTIFHNLLCPTLGGGKLIPILCVMTLRCRRFNLLSKARGAGEGFWVLFPASLSKGGLLFRNLTYLSKSDSAMVTEKKLLTVREGLLGFLSVFRSCSGHDYLTHPLKGGDSVQHPGSLTSSVLEGDHLAVFKTFSVTS